MEAAQNTTTPMTSWFVTLVISTTTRIGTIRIRASDRRFGRAMGRMSRQVRARPDLQAYRLSQHRQASAGQESLPAGIGDHREGAGVQVILGQAGEGYVDRD